ncbi:hypothetical protein SJI45_01565 [Streptomyces sp. S399]|uniref:hypothetical protein n=1 Tax=Streptomyces sp. S399 TaxID=3096009 RepID=UPI002A823DCF|nr:hypothetical protein [Streptomyces sp. S399]WPR49975.1 hypothetical protein SJI45_01565 [Streptomyces sp. S399]
MLTSAGPLAEVHRTLAVFAEAAGLDRDRVRRRARVHAAQAVFHGRRHCFRIARGGPGRPAHGVLEWVAEEPAPRAGRLADHDSG